MTLTIHQASVPVFVQGLKGLRGVLTKAAAHVETRKLDPDALLKARLFPDMFPLAKQVVVACDFARGVSGRLAGAELPALEGDNKSFADLRGLIAASLDFIGGLDPAAFEAAGSREIVLRPGTPKERRLSLIHI